MPNNIKIDLRRISRIEFREYTRRIGEAKTPLEQDEITGELLEATVIEWPYGEISKESYLNMSLLDSIIVDEAMDAALAVIAKKKSARQSTWPENIDSR